MQIQIVDSVSTSSCCQQRLPDLCHSAAACVAAIVADLKARSVALPGGVTTWRAAGDDAAAGASRRALGVHLYDGTCGVALFLAAYHRVSGDDEAARLAWRALAPLRAKVAQLEARRADATRAAIGGFVGLGSFLYTLLLLAGWFESDELLESARTTAALLTPEVLGGHEECDVVSGLAGALLALLRLEREAALSAAQREQALEVAALCGRRLLARRSTQANGLRAWAGTGSPALSGFAHGAAGIGHALVKLFERTGSDESRVAALEGFAWERSLYDAQAETWLDTRTGRPLEQAAWCHGAPGIALGRCASGAALREAAVAADFELALGLTRALPEARRDLLCCGNAGRIEILASLGRACGRAELLDDAWRLTRPLLTRREHGAAPDEPLGLLSGAAGVGYTLLRLLHPEQLPCVLLLE